MPGASAIGAPPDLGTRYDDVVISMDSHTHLYVDLKPYLPERFGTDFDAAVARSGIVMKAGFELFEHEAAEDDIPIGGAAELVDGRFPSGRVHSFAALTEGMTIEARLGEIDADGIAGEFVTEFGGAVSLDPAFMHARFDAYCRWFADYFAPAMHRFTGSANVTLLAGMGTVVEEIGHAAEHGLRAIQLPGKVATMSTTLPPYNAMHYEPMWAALEERGMAAVFHSGLGPEKPLLTFPGLEPGAEELAVVTRRTGPRDALPPILLGGVLERHPGLKIGYIECGTQWIPPLLHELDGVVRRSKSAAQLLPSEVWHRQGFAAGPMTMPEIEGRYDIGVETLMWGSDYPHAEGSYPHSWEYLDKLFAGVPPTERRAIQCENAARFAGFDLEQLASTPAAHRR